MPSCKTKASFEDNPIAANPNTGNPGKKRTVSQKWRLVSLNNKLIVVFAGLTTIATVVYSVFAGWQLYEIHSGAKDTHDLAVAADTQAKKMADMSTAADKIRQAAEGMVTQEQRVADNAQKALESSNRQSKSALDSSIAASRLDQRAWVGVSSAELTQFEANKPLHFDVVLLNTGKTPAHKTRECSGWVLARVYLREPPNDVVAKCEKDWQLSHDLPPQGKFINRAGEAQLGSSPEDQGNAVYIAQSYDAIKAKIQILYIFGEYEYRDLTGETHTTRYCLYLADPDTKTIQFCDGFNDMN